LGNFIDQYVGTMHLDGIIVDALGYLAAGIVFLTFCMKTMLALRIIAIASNTAFIVYALAADLMPVLLLHAALLPLNLLRLAQMRRMARLAGEVARTTPTADQFDWLIPLGHRRNLPDGATLFRKGEPANSLFVIAEGSIVLPEIGVTLGPGALLGEVALFSPSNLRTTSAEARGPVQLFELTERRVEELYFDNPVFAYRLIRLITRRLLSNMVQQERELEARLAAATLPAGAARRSGTG